MSMTRRATLLLALGGSLLAGSAFAGEKSNFAQPAFDAAQKAGKPVLVEIAAPWCPTCKTQAPILGELRNQPKFKDLQVFTVDFDSQKDVVKALKAQTQSTLIVRTRLATGAKSRNESYATPEPVCGTSTSALTVPSSSV